MPKLLYEFHKRPECRYQCHHLLPIEGTIFLSLQPYGKNTPYFSLKKKHLVCFFSLSESNFFGVILLKSCSLLPSNFRNNQRHLSKRSLLFFVCLSVTSKEKGVWHVVYAPANRHGGQARKRGSTTAER